MISLCFKDKLSAYLCLQPRKASDPQDLAGARLFVQVPVIVWPWLNRVRFRLTSAPAVHTYYVKKIEPKLCRHYSTRLDKNKKNRLLLKFTEWHDVLLSRYSIIFLWWTYHYFVVMIYFYIIYFSYIFGSGNLFSHTIRIS